MMTSDKIQRYCDENFEEPWADVVLFSGLILFTVSLAAVFVFGLYLIIKVSVMFVILFLLPALYGIIFKRKK